MPIIEKAGRQTKRKWIYPQIPTLTLLRTIVYFLVYYSRLFFCLDEIHAHTHTCFPRPARQSAVSKVCPEESGFQGSHLLLTLAGMVAGRRGWEAVKTRRDQKPRPPVQALDVQSWKTTAIKAGVDRATWPWARREAQGSFYSWEEW